MDEREIPEAIREDIELPKKSSLTLLPIVIGVIFFLVAGGLLLAFFWLGNFKSAEKTVTPDVTITSQPEAQPKPKLESKTIDNISPTAKPKPTSESKTIDNISPTAKPKPNKVNLLGHLPYDVAPESELETIDADNTLRMRPAAAAKFKQMQADALADGVNLVPISAFRTAEDQSQLFFGVKEQKVQGTAQRAEVSAPPGYSEHHTGYAVDIGDANAPATHVEPEFANTAAFAWLKKNAPKYSFELSFPPNNEQGVSYEPWHWRFVGDRHSLETFYQRKN